MNTQIKVSSNEGGIFTGANNRCSFTLAGNSGHYDLSSAHVNLICSVPITAEEERSATNAGANPFAEGVGTITYNTASTANGRGVYSIGARMNDDGGTARAFDFENAVLVKNINMRSSQFGNIEHCKRNDIYSASINAYSKNMGDRAAMSYGNLFKVAQISNSFDSIFGDYNKEGTVSSRNIQRQAVRIPLKDMLNFANVRQYDSGKFGRTDIDLELNIDKVVVSNLMGQDTNFILALGNDETGSAMGNQNLFQCLNLTAAIGADMTELQIGSSQTVYRAFQRLEDCPYYVGQKLYVAALYTQGTDTAARNTSGQVLLVTRRITEIKYNRGENNVGMTGAANNTNSITLVLNAALEGSGALAGTGTYTNVSVRGAECTLGAFQVDFAELEVKQINPANVVDDGGAPIVYKSYDTEEFSTPAVVNFRRIFECPPNAHNLFIANTSETAAGAGTNGLVSRLQEIRDYRLRIDNKDCSDRQIRLRDTAAAGVNAPTQDPLHLQKLIVALKNSDKPVKGLQERYQEAVGTNARSGLFRNKYQTDSAVIGQVLPITDRPKQVQVEINTGANGITGLTLFKEVVKTIG
jgi:hypothetical protein